MYLVLFTGPSCMHFGAFIKHVWGAGCTELEAVWHSLRLSLPTAALEPWLEMYRHKITLGSLVILVHDLTSISFDAKEINTGEVL